MGRRRAHSFYDGDALARQLYDIRTTAFIRILMDQGIYVSDLVADGLMGGAVLATLQGTPDVSAVRALGVLPRWTAWIACISAALCVLSVPAMFAGPVDASGFYNAGGGDLRSSPTSHR